MNAIIPNIFVKDMTESISFYEQIGFSVSMQVPETGDSVWVMMTNGAVSIMFQTFDSLGDALPEISREPGGSLLLYMQVNGINEFYESTKNKVPILKDLEKTFYGATEFSIVDTNGYVLTFAENESR